MCWRMVGGVCLCQRFIVTICAENPLALRAWLVPSMIRASRLPHCSVAITRVFSPSAATFRVWTQNAVICQVALAFLKAKGVKSWVAKVSECSGQRLPSLTQSASLSCLLRAWKAQFIALLACLAANASSRPEAIHAISVL
jgi:hypothetical protein